MAKITVTVDSHDFLRAMYALDERITAYETHLKECGVADPEYWTPRIAELKAARGNLEAAYDAATHG